MKYFNLEVGEEVYHLRLTSEKCIEIEKTKEIKLLDYVQDYSIITIITLLRYMMSFEKPCTQNMAQDLFDKLVDEGYSLKDILEKVIYETLVVSGVISREDLENIKNPKEVEVKN